MLHGLDRQVLERVAGSARRSVIGNSAGLRLTVAGRRTLRSARRHQDLDKPAVTPLADMRARTFHRAGVLRFDSSTSGPIVEAVATAFDDAMSRDEWCEDRGPSSAPAAHRYLVDAPLRLPAITDLLTDDVVSTAEAYYGCHVRVRSVRAYRNQGIEALDQDEDVHANVWHLDPELTCDLRYFVFLTAVGAGDGPLETVNRRSTAAILRSGFLDGRHVVGPARHILNRQAVVHNGAAGTGVLLAAEHCLHRAHVCSPGHHRDVVQFWLTPSSEPLGPDWGAQMPPDPAFHGGRPGDG